MHKLSRRRWLKLTGAAAAMAPLSAYGDSNKSEALVPARAITSGPKHHWFGYYDKLELDPTNRYVLSNEVGFEHRTPTPDDQIAVGMVDTAEDDRWIPLGTSNAWGWQQGCMLQWRPGSKSQVIWNDRDGDHFVSHIKDVFTGEQRTLPRPIYALSPDGKFAVTADFARIQNMREGYGYKGAQDTCENEKAPEASGVWRVDLDSGDSELIVSLAKVAKIPHDGEPTTNYWNYFNHLLVGPDGKRFIFLHRWRKTLPPVGQRARGGFITRMFTANADGSDLYVLDPSGHTSHFIWRDPEHVCAWTRPRGKPSAFYLIKDKTSEIEVVGKGVMTRNGHNTYLPAHQNEWILNDTYPDRNRLQTPYLFHVPTKKRVDLGHFYLPPEYQGEWRCDLHPRSSNDGKTVAIDSPHGGEGRQVWLLDVSEVVG